MKYKIETIVFFTGLVGMILEIIGSRIINPYFGNSIFVWTSIIGIVLGSLSLGYHLGGKIADRKLEFRLLSFILLTAGLFIVLAATFEAQIMQTLSFIKDIRLGSFLAALILFSFPSLCLGMVTPYCTKLKIKEENKFGTAIGNIYAISTAGSILGTFLAGFVLVTFFGSQEIMFISAGILIILSFFTSINLLSKKGVMIIILLAILAFSSFVPKPNNPLEIETPYNRYFIVDHDYENQPVRSITDQFDVIQTSISKNSPNVPVSSYISRFLDLSSLVNEHKNSLMIGAGAYSLPRSYAIKYPDSKITTVEIDQKLLEIAKKYFFYNESPNSQNFGEDGRVFLNDTESSFDNIFIDVFKGKSVPSYMTTVEVVKEIRHHLTESGAVYVNVVSSLNGPRSKFLKSQFLTYKTVFPHTYLYAVEDCSPSEQALQNYIIISYKEEPQKPPVDANGHFCNFDGAGGVVLTDNFSPTDQLLELY